MGLFDFLKGGDYAASNAWSAPAASVMERPVANEHAGKTTAQLVAEIHGSFNGAADKLLADAKAVLAGTDVNSIQKGERLKAAGFGSTKQAVQTNEAAALAKAASEQQALLMDYALRYPTNKFITRDMVDAIAAKYNLVVGPTTAYTGFVPEKNLRELEAFATRLQQSDVPAKSIKITKLSHEKTGGPWLQMFPTLEIPVDSIYLRCPDSKQGGSTCCLTDKFSDASKGWGYLFFESYTVIDKGAQLIVAPAKDMDLSALEQHNGQWFKAKHVHVPDPVVLQPVKGGYLVCTAWGEEASDPLVVNQQLN